MVNHVRTLLMNRGREGHRLTDPGEEYIPANYRVRIVDRPLALLRTTLFGNNPDRLFLNYRMRQLMQVIHATQLAPDLLLDDARITYLPFHDDLFTDAFRVRVTQPPGQQLPVDVTGTHVANMSAGLTTQAWDVSVGGDGAVTVVSLLGAPDSRDLTVINDSPVPLHGSALQLYLHGATTGTRFRVDSAARPELDIAAVLNNTAAAMGQQGLSGLLPVVAGSPLITWQRIWNAHPDAVVKFAAMLLAIAYRTSQMPQGVVT